MQARSLACFRRQALERMCLNLNSKTPVSKMRTEISLAPRVAESAARRQLSPSGGAGFDAQILASPLTPKCSACFRKSCAQSKRFSAGLAAFTQLHYLMEAAN